MLILLHRLTKQVAYFQPKCLSCELVLMLIISCCYLSNSKPLKHYPRWWHHHKPCNKTFYLEGWVSGSERYHSSSADKHPSCWVMSLGRFFFANAWKGRWPRDKQTGWALGRRLCICPALLRATRLNSCRGDEVMGETKSDAAWQKDNNFNLVQSLSSQSQFREEAARGKLHLHVYTTWVNLFWQKHLQDIYYKVFLCNPDYYRKEWGGRKKPHRSKSLIWEPPLFQPLKNCGFLVRASAGFVCCPSSLFLCRMHSVIKSLAFPFLSELL